ncbi:MAG: hypothetical protein ACR2NP_13770 [Pirellulaceae bacterium]
MPRKYLLPIFLFALIAFSGDAVEAQFGIHHVCLEAKVAQSDSVYVGAISSYQRKELPGQTPGNARLEYTFVVSIGDTLKGDAREEITLVFHTYPDDERMKAWHEAETAFLWFVRARTDQDQDPTDPLWGLIRLDDPVEDENGYGGDPGWTFCRLMTTTQVITMELQTLTDRDEILNCVREFAAGAPDSIRMHGMETSPVIGGGDACSITIPIVPELEDMAKRLINSPEEFLPNQDHHKSTLYKLRESGIVALRHFETMENISLLESLLDDPYFVTMHSGDEAPWKRYVLRYAAAEVLKGWNLKIDDSVVLEEKD